MFNLYFTEKPFTLNGKTTKAVFFGCVWYFHSFELAYHGGRYYGFMDKCPTGLAADANQYETAEEAMRAFVSTMHRVGRV